MAFFHRRSPPLLDKAKKYDVAECGWSHVCGLVLFTAGLLTGQLVQSNWSLRSSPTGWRLSSHEILISSTLRNRSFSRGAAGPMVTEGIEKLLGPREVAALGEKLVRAVRAAARKEALLEAALQAATDRRRKLNETRHVAVSRVLEQASLARSLVQSETTGGATSAASVSAQRPATWQQGPTPGGTLAQAVEAEVAAQLAGRVGECMKLRDACRTLETWLAQAQQQTQRRQRGDERRRSEPGAVESGSQLGSKDQPANQSQAGDEGAGDADVGTTFSSAEEAAMAADLASCTEELWSSCRLHLPHSDWITARHAPLANQSSAPASSGDHERGEDRRAFGKVALDQNDTWRDVPGLEAPPVLWQRDMYSYPGSLTVSFLLQYFKKPEIAPEIVKRLYQCTEGQRGLGRLRGVTSELVVHVDEPSGHAMWRELWESTKGGKFLVPIFSHDLQEVRGYNRAAHVAKGELLILLQDDELPPESCDWLERILRAFDAWPRLGMLGMRSAHFWIDPACRWCNYNVRLAWEADKMVYYDRNSGVRMQFASVVDSSPSVYRRSVYFEVGSQDEGLMGKKGESGIYCDWEMAIRMWLAGYQVVVLSISEDEVFRNPPDVEGGTHYGRQSYLRTQNYYLLRDAWSLEEKRIFEEVKRVNDEFLTKVSPWM